MAKTKNDDDSPVYDLESLLQVSPDELLTLAEVDSKIDEFLEREVQ